MTPSRVPNCLSQTAFRTIMTIWSQSLGIPLSLHGVEGRSSQMSDFDAPFSTDKESAMRMRFCSTLAIGLTLLCLPLRAAPQSATSQRVELHGRQRHREHCHE